MRYTDQDIKIDNKPVKQINIAQARKEWLKGTKIFMNPCNLTLVNPWTQPFSFTREPKIDLDFEILIDEVKIYNCDNERGRYLNYFIQK